MLLNMNLRRFNEDFMPTKVLVGRFKVRVGRFRVSVGRFKVRVGSIKVDVRRFKVRVGCFKVSVRCLNEDFMQANAALGCMVFVYLAT